MDPLPALVQHIPVSRAICDDRHVVDEGCRKFFIFVISLNGVGLLLASLNIWTYPRRYTGAFVLGNLLFAILMRNELFGRLLYMIVNKCFAKVSDHSDDKVAVC